MIEGKLFTEQELQKELPVTTMIVSQIEQLLPKYVYEAMRNRVVIF